MEHDFSNLLTQDIERAILHLESHLSGPSPHQENLDAWLAQALQWAYTLQALAAVKGMAHLETYAAQLNQVLNQAKAETANIGLLLVESELPRIRETFQNGVNLYRDTMHSRPKISKKLSHFVETLYELEHQDPAKLYGEPDETASAKQVNLDMMLRGFIPWVQQTAAAQEKDIDVRLEMSSGIRVSPEITGQIQTVLVHLLRNAVTHGIESAWTRRLLEKPARGQVVLTATLERGDLKLTITDDGCGIDETGKAFNPVQSAIPLVEPSASDNTAVETSIYASGNAKTGLGVGLHIIHSITQRLGGSLELDSQPCKGTTATVRFSLSALRPQS